MHLDPGRLSAVLTDLYAAAADPIGLEQLPAKLAKAFDATSCLLHTRAKTAEGVTILGATDNVTSLMPAYTQHYHERDLWAVRGAKCIGRALVGEEIVPERELIDAEWYYDLCRPFGVHHIVGAVFEVEDKVEGQIGVHRAPDAAAFELGDRAMMDLLIPHLKQVYRLLRIGDRARRGQNLGFEILGALSVCVFVVTGTGQVRMMNPLAERFIKTKVPISVRNGRLQLADPKLDGQLSEYLRRASLAPLGKSLSSGGTILVPAAEDEKLLLTVVPVPPEAGVSSFVEPLAAVLIGDPSYHAAPDPALIRAMYGLTGAETRVLLAIVKGQNLPEYAREAGVSINTAHSQAKSVFAKTACRRQADLVAKVLHRPILRIARIVGG